MDKRRPVKSCQELGSIPSAPANSQLTLLTLNKVKSVIMDFVISLNYHRLRNSTLWEL